MIVVTRHGKTTIITGWRAWLASAAVLVVAVAILCLAFVAFGLVLTIGAAALILLPVAIGIGLIASLFRRPPRP